MKIRFLLITLFLAGGAFLSACSGKANTSTPSNSAPDDTALLSEVSGTVQIKNPGQTAFINASNDDILQVGGIVRTGSDGRVRLNFSSGTIVRVAPNSFFTLASNEPADKGLLTRLLMRAGELWVILNGGEMQIETPSGTASVRGSYMSVWLDPATEDVWVTCLEGWCTAENPAAVMEMIAGQGCTLFSFDPEGNVPPPPPMLRYLTQQEIEKFLANNPEAQQILQAMMATATALPPLPTLLSPMPQESCFELGLPQNGAEIAADGMIQFDWNDQPGAYKYTLTVVKPNGAERSWHTWRSSLQVDAFELPLEGNYLWTVTAYDFYMRPICTSDSWTFTKPAHELPAKDCSALLSPEDGFELPQSGPVIFSWEDHPEAYKYILVITQPNGTEVSRQVWMNTYTLPAEMFTQPGEYHWQVTAYSSRRQPICASQQHTFKRSGEIPTPPPAEACISLLTPENNASLPASGAVTFEWMAHPDAFKYIINFKLPNQAQISLPEFDTSHTRYMDALTPGGQYEWWVTVKNSNMENVCYSEHFTFTKPASFSPTSTPPPNPNLMFWNRQGPTGNINECQKLFSVDVNAPHDSIVKVIFSTDPIPNGDQDPHHVLSNVGGTKYQANVCLDGIGAGVTIYWRFAIYKNGVYIHDDNIYSFTSPGCPLTPPPDTPTTFQNQSGPNGTISVCTNHYQVDAIDPDELQYVKVAYKVYDGGGNLVLEDHQHLNYQGGDTWAGDLYIPVQPGGQVVWWFWAIDNDGNNATSSLYSFEYTGGSACP